jgi:hypothetical protein
MFNLYGSGGTLELLGTESGLTNSAAPTGIAFSYEATDDISFTANGASFNLVLGMQTSASTGLVETITGTANGQAITGLLSSFEGADNMVNNNPGIYVDGNGISFQTTTGNDYNLYYGSGVAQIVGTGFGTFDVEGETLTTEPACFCRGTAILTAGGERPIETLRIGDVLVTASGAHRAIRWIGTRAYDPRFAARNPSVWPVRIAAGALADGVPKRDLFVSPCHALYLDGVLVEASHLLNFVTITQPAPASIIDYVHVELESHDVILAEGAPAETFLDRDCRAMFDNAATYKALYPDAVSATAPVFYARRVENGAALASIRARLAVRAGVAPSSATAPGPLQGRLDLVDLHAVRGWALDASAPERAVELELRVDGTCIGRVVANRRRPDLAAIGNGTGCHSFDLRWPQPLDPSAWHSVEVARASDGALLPGGLVLLPPLRQPHALAAEFAAELANMRAAGDVASLDKAIALLGGSIEALLAAPARAEREAREQRFWPVPEVERPAA